MIASAPGTAHTPRAHITNMAGLGKSAFNCYPRALPSLKRP